MNCGERRVPLCGIRTTMGPKIARWGMCVCDTSKAFVSEFCWNKSKFLRMAIKSTGTVCGCFARTIVNFAGGIGVCECECEVINFSAASNYIPFIFKSMEFPVCLSMLRFSFVTPKMVGLFRTIKTGAQLCLWIMKVHNSISVDRWKKIRCVGERIALWIYFTRYSHLHLHLYCHRALLKHLNVLCNT